MSACHLLTGALSMWRREQAMRDTQPPITDQEEYVGYQRA